MSCIARGEPQVELVRIERSPGGAWWRTLAAASVTPTGRRRAPFALQVPADVPPSVTGRHSSLHYLLRARTGSGDGEIPASAPVRITGHGHVHVGQRSEWLERFIANASARHFHLELSDAALSGGGRIAGRLHRHGPWPPELLTVAARCVETWCRVRASMRRPATWDEATLWEDQLSLPTDPDRTWMPFAFALPGELPPAIEAQTVAWRYEITARRPLRLRRIEAAALTPFLFECT